MKFIPLTQGKFALVDDEDYEQLSQYKWCAVKDHNTYYAVRGVYLGMQEKRQKQTTIRMHREILQVPTDKETDHKDGNGLNNQKSNLRVCNRLQNRWNSFSQSNSTSKFKGVSWFGWGKRKKRWVAEIMYKARRIHLGYFISEKQAARAYDQAAIQYYGQFAYTNFRELPE